MEIVISDEIREENPYKNYFFEEYGYDTEATTNIDPKMIIKKLGDKYYLSKHPDPLVKGHCLLFKSNSRSEAKTGPKKNLK